MAAYYKVSVTIAGDIRNYVEQAGSFAMAVSKAMDHGDRRIPAKATVEVTVERFEDEREARDHARELLDRGIWHQGDTGPFTIEDLERKEWT
jgi:hypothetical protein